MKRTLILCCCAVGLIGFAAVGQAVEDNTSAETPTDEALTADAAGAKDHCKCAGEAGSESVAKIQEALRGRLRSNGLNYVDTPLEEVANVLQNEYGIPIAVHVRALEQIGLGPDEPVTISLHNISLRAGLRLMLQQLGLTYIIRNEVLMITTPEEAESNLIVCVYDVSGLADDTDQSIRSLIDAIVSCVATETWSQNGGGEAELRPLKPGLLVIAQTHHVHEEVAHLLDALREMRKQVPLNQGSSAEPASNEKADNNADNGARSSTGGGGIF
jgi:hypothetical protein